MNAEQDLIENAINIGEDCLRTKGTLDDPI